MRSNRGRAADVDDGVEFDGRGGRRSKADSPDLDEARESWEPIVCPECGTDHPNTLSVRLKRTGREIEARCSECGAIAARYTSGVWSS